MESERIKDSVKKAWVEIDGYFQSLQQLTASTARSIAHMRFKEALEYLKIQEQMINTFIRKLEDFLYEL